MTYNLKLSNGSTLVNIGDGVSDTSYTSITLFGKNFAGYGPLLNENQVYLLENFANLAPPRNPLQGQLWWDTSTNQMKVRSLQDWKIIGGPTPAPIAPPVGNNVGDQWWNTDTQQLNVFNGAGWSVVGPIYSRLQGVSGPIVKTVMGELDNIARTVTAFYSDGAIVSVLSNNPTFSTVELPGFYVVRPGFSLTSIGAPRYYGDADNALNLGGVLAANFLRSDVDSVTQNKLSIKSDLGLTVGTFDDLNIAVQNNEISFFNNVVGRSVGFYTKDSLAQQTLALSIDGATNRVSIATAPVSANNIAHKGYVDAAINTSASTLLRADGSTAIIGNLSPQTNGLYSLGGASTRFNTLFSINADLTTIASNHGTFNLVTINDAPTVSTSGTNKAYVDTKVANSYNQSATDTQASAASIVGGAPSTLATLGKIATAINNDPAFYDTISAEISLKAPSYNPTFTGNPTVSTPALTDSTNTIANTQFVTQKVDEAVLSIQSTTSPVTQTAIDAAILALKTIPTFIGQIAAPQGVKVTGIGIVTDTNNSLDIGSPGFNFRNVYAQTFKGVASQAAYADLAEMYVADAQYEPGTVLEFGGEQEVTVATPWTSKVAGVVSTNPAYLMNDACVGQYTVSIALQGRCPAKVHGPVEKGDLLVSAGNGYAERQLKPALGTVIGKSLEDFAGKSGVIEISISRC